MHMNKVSLTPTGINEKPVPKGENTEAFISQTKYTPPHLESHNRVQKAKDPCHKPEVVLLDFLTSQCFHGNEWYSVWKADGYVVARQILIQTTPVVDRVAMKK